MDIIKFGKKVKEVVMEDRSILKLPTYCNRRINYYSYNKETKTVEISCKLCERKYPVLKAEKINGGWQWKDIHNEDDYHFISEISGYDSCCNSCKKIKEKNIEQNRLDKVNHTILLTPCNKQYLQLRKVLYKEEISKIVNDLIDNERKRNPIKWIE